MRALIVGAGAVGQVYGHVLRRSGVEVGFLVREKYAEECGRGFTLFPLNGRKRPPERLEGHRVVTGASPSDWQGWDTIYVTVSSAALRSGRWIAEMGAHSGDATIVSLQPGLDDRKVLLEHVSDERLLSGMISLISYQAPLPGETRFPGPGLAYWFPPLAPTPFSGSPARVSSVIEALRRGGMPVKRHRDVPGSVAFPNAILMTHLVALEGAGWTFDGVRRGDWLRLAWRAATEAMAIVARERRIALPFSRHFLGPTIFRLLLRLAPRLVPLDLETYLAVHFKKVIDQTRLSIRGMLTVGEQLSLPAPSLEELVQRVGWPAAA
jgi:2-dehydropantoate 2-reductase